METFLGHTIRTRNQGGSPSGNYSQGGRPLQEKSICVDARKDAQVNTAFWADRARAAPRHRFAHQPTRNLVHGSETAAVPFHPDTNGTAAVFMGLTAVLLRSFLPALGHVVWSVGRVVSLDA